MKKIFAIISLLTLLGCTNEKIQENNQTINNQNKNEIIENEIDEPEIIDENPIIVGLYKDKSLVKTAKTTLGNHKDIDSYYVYFTNKETLDTTNAKTNYHKYYQEYENIDNYKIGFHISFEVEDKLIEKTIIDASSTHSMGPYLYVYLYDDINVADGIWYSHLEPEDITEDTILSSIKLYLAGEGSKITSPIELTVFTYDEDDLDESNNYLGDNSYTLIIETK